MKSSILFLYIIGSVFIFAGLSSASGHRSGDIYWDYSQHRPCPEGYLNCDGKGSCGRKTDSCSGKHPAGDIYWDYNQHRPCPEGYVNCKGKGSCGRKGNASVCN
ncbi:MAG: hypothetical protein JRJ68_01355 [Deltaproteobacteria bacterium]|nr:hypothetical protein [Deltaproteobacteria bacterium]